MTVEVLDKIEEDVLALDLKIFVERHRTMVVSTDTDGDTTRRYEWSFDIKVLNFGEPRRVRVVLMKEIGRKAPAPRQKRFEYALDLPTISTRSMAGLRHDIKGDDRDRYWIEKIQVLDDNGHVRDERTVGLDLGAGHAENRPWTFVTVLTLPFQVFFGIWAQLFTAPWLVKPVFLIFALASPIFFLLACALTIIILPFYTVGRLLGLVGRSDEG